MLIPAEGRLSTHSGSTFRRKQTFSSRRTASVVASHQLR